MNLNRDKIEGIVVSFGIHLAVILLLFFMILRTEVPSELGGVMVNFGDVNEAAGTFEPGGGEHIPEQRPVPPPVPRPQDASEPGMITQDLEESVTLTEAQKKEKEKKRQEEIARQEEIRRQQAEQQKIAEEQRKRNEINSRVAGAFGGAGLGDNDGAGAGAGGGQGSGLGDGQSGSGNQGSPFGNAEHGANEGVGGYGSFALDGRSIGSGGLPRPAYTTQIEGKIVVSITVDPKGNVIGATIGRGTNIDNASMRNAALEAARRASFNSIAGTNNQTGTITYNYRLR